MTTSLDNLERWAREAIAKREELRKQHPGIFESPAAMTLVLKRQSRRGERMRLAGRWGPLGHILAEPSDTESVVSFDAGEVLAWVQKTRQRLT